MTTRHIFQNSKVFIGGKELTGFGPDLAPTSYTANVECTVIPYRPVKKGDRVLALRSTGRLRGIAPGKSWNRKTYAHLKGSIWTSDSGPPDARATVFFKGATVTPRKMDKAPRFEPDAKVEPRN